MKAQTAKRFGALSALVALLVSGTGCGASPAVKANQAPEAAPLTQFENPEMQSAAERVQKAENQLELAKRQLSAARSLLKAAEADLKAARADRDSVAMRYHAQDLAEQAGMPVQAGRAVAATAPAVVAPTGATVAPVVTRTQIADRGVGTSASTSPTPAAATAVPPTLDFNALPQQNETDPQPAPNLQLR